MRPARRDLLILLALCAPTFFLGLTTHGLTNWQESMRALVARDMQARGEWLVPTVHGEPYLAKPPMIYWAQLALASAFGRRAGEFELRLVVALAATIGVLGTYALTLRLTPRQPGAAIWAGAFVATAPLFVRPGRIGEIDGLVPPFTIAGVWAIHRAWRSHLDRGRTDVLAVLAAALAAAGAMLTKGPPGVLALALAGYGGILLHAAWNREDPPPGRRAILAVSITGAIALPLLGTLRSGVHSFDDALGAACLAGAGAFVGGTLSRLSRPTRARRAWGALARTHPVGVLGFGALALWAWSRLVAARIGSASVVHAAQDEAADNLNVLVLSAWKDNLESAVFGAGLGSFAVMAAIVLWRRERKDRAPGAPFSPEGAILLAWIALSLLAFSTLGKGIPRYLTPIWPAMAIAGGAWFSRVSLESPRTRVVVGACVVVLACAQSWWYSWGREVWAGWRCPRSLLAELEASFPGACAELACFEFSTPAIDYYLDRPVESFHDDPPKPGINYVGPRTVRDLVGELAAEPDSERWLLIRQEQPNTLDPEPARDRLERAGLVITAPSLGSSFVIDSGRARVIPVIVRVREP